MKDTISCGQRSQMRICFLSVLFHVIVTSTTSDCIVSPYGDGCLVPEFSDEFETFNISKLNHAVTMSGCENGEFEIYVPDPANAFVENGSLHIHLSYTADWFNKSMCTDDSDPFVDWIDGCELSFDALPNRTIYDANITYLGVYPGKCTDPENDGCARRATPSNILNPIISARIYSNFSFLYGRVEVRAKLPVGNWLWPAIWMMPKNDTYGSWPFSGEIDIMESRGNDANYTAGENNRFGSTSLHWGRTPKSDQWNKTHQDHVDEMSTLTSEWHIYGMKWTSTALCTYLDNDTNRVLIVNMSVPLWDQFHLDALNPWAGYGINTPFNQPFYMLLNTAIGATNGYFPENDWDNGNQSAFWVNRDGWQSAWIQPDLLIDYVHLYQ